MDWGTEFTVTDEFSGESYRWGQANYVRLDPSSALRTFSRFGPADGRAARLTRRPERTTAWIGV